MPQSNLSQRSSSNAMSWPTRFTKMSLRTGRENRRQLIISTTTLCVLQAYISLLLRGFKALRNAYSDFRNMLPLQPTLGSKRFSLDTTRCGNQLKRLKPMSGFDNGRVPYQILRSGNFPRQKGFGQLERFFRLWSQSSLYLPCIGLILLSRQQLCTQTRI
jgi:hypothetical protein